MLTLPAVAPCVEPQVVPCVMRKMEADVCADQGWSLSDCFPPKDVPTLPSDHWDREYSVMEAHNRELQRELREACQYDR